MLPDFYLERYEALSGAIDPVFHSTYVQFLLGKVIVEISMAPPLFRRFARWPNESTIELSTLESPDCRMKSLLDIFKQSSHELLDIIERNTLRQISDMALPEGFSVQDEAAWQSLEPDKSAKLEASLFDSVRGWLYPLAETRFRCLSFDNTWLSEANRFVLRLCQIGDVDPALLTIPMSQRFTMDEVTWRKARRHCLTVVTNHVAEQVSLRPISGQDPMEILTGETPESRVFITESISKGDPEGLQWNCIQQGREGFFSGFKITHDQLSSFLSVRKMLASAGLYIPTIDLGPTLQRTVGLPHRRIL